MTREEVISILQNIDPQCQNDCPISRDDCAKQENKCLVSEALEYAVDFLSADVVEVVRCKDCKYKHSYFTTCCLLDGLETINLDSFCSKGVKRETK